jgi:hypothetical protein
MQKQILTAIFILLAIFITPVFANTGTGTIQGSLAYPSDYLPSLIVCAQSSIKNEDKKYCLQSKEGQRSYSIKVPAGQYYVFVSNIGLQNTTNFYAITGFYTKFVTCGLTEKCTNRSPIAVTVKTGQVVKNIDPKDFYGKLSKRCP